MFKTNSSLSSTSSSFLSIWAIEVREEERDAVEEEESGAERHYIHWKGLISEGDASKSDKKFWDILKTKVEWWGDGEREGDKRGLWHI